MGRPRKKGRRTDAGRLSRAGDALRERNAPSSFVSARQDRFRHFMGESSIGYEMTCAGRLMLVGAFDDLELEPRVILDALTSYCQSYWGNYRGGPKMGSYEQESKGQEGCQENPETGLAVDTAGDWFERQDEILRGLGAAARKCIHEVTVDRHWFPDEDVSWVSRIINSRMLQKRAALATEGKRPPDSLVVRGELACDSDWAMLSLLRFAAPALALGIRPRMAKAA